jgi:hypothetical protein
MGFRAFGSLPKHNILVGFSLFRSLQCWQPHTTYRSTEPYENSPNPSTLLKIHYSIVLPSNPGLPHSLNRSNFYTQTLKALSFSPMHAICLVHLILLHLITLICTQNISWSPHYEIFSSPLLLHLRPTDFHRILLVNNLSLLLFQQHRLGWYMTVELAARWLETVWLFAWWDWQNSWKFQAGYLVCRLRLLHNNSTDT